MRRDNLTFIEALAALGLNGQQPPRTQPRKPTIQRPPISEGVNDLKEDYPALTNDAWQAAAKRFVWDCSERLWDESGARALAYLRGRGLTDSVITVAELGYNPTDINTSWGGVEVWLPRGIIIPWLIDGLYWRINIRRPVTGKEKRYIQPAGCAAAGLYMPYVIGEETIVIMCEGEFDALTVPAAGVMRYGIKAVATGSTGGARLLRWVVGLRMVKRVLLAFDYDQAGIEAAAWWTARLAENAAPLYPPAGKDLNECYQQLSPVEFYSWLKQEWSAANG